MFVYPETSETPPPLCVFGQEMQLAVLMLDGNAELGGVAGDQRVQISASGQDCKQANCWC